MAKMNLSTMEKDTLAEIGNISLGSAATALSNLVNNRVEITTPKITVTTLQDLEESYDMNSIVVEVEYLEGLQGENALILKQQDAGVIANLMMGKSPEDVVEELQELELSAIMEAMNQMMGSAATAMSDFFDRKVDISPPKVERVNLGEEGMDFSFTDKNEPLVHIAFDLEIGDFLKSKLFQLMPIAFAREMTRDLLKKMGIEVDELLEEEDETPQASHEEEDAADQEEVEDDPDPGFEDGKELSEEPETQELSLTDIEKDTLAEIGNISLGSSATALSNLLNRRVQITTPRVSITTMEKIKKNFPVPSMLVSVHYIKGLKGDNVLIMKKEDALIIVGLMMGMEPPDKPESMGEMEMSAIQEAMNQMMGSSATAMSDFFAFMIDISPPTLKKIDLSNEDAEVVELDEQEPVIQIAFNMEVEDLIDSELLQIVPLEHGKEMVKHLMDSYGGGEDVEEGSYFEEEKPPEALEKEEPEPALHIEEKEEEREPAYFGSPPVEEDFDAPAKSKGKSRPSIDEDKLSLIRDIPIELEVVLGRARIPLKSLGSLGSGAVIALDKFAGEPVELLANNKLVARGEVVLVNGHFGIKITSLEKAQ